MKLGYIKEIEHRELMEKLDQTARLPAGFISFTANRLSPVADRSSGQSLIETIVAIFVLTTGLASGLALAIYSFGASSDILERITATGLAREGIEIVRRMRDSNWLNDTLTDCDNGQRCYEDWLDKTYKIKDESGSGAGSMYRIRFFPERTDNKWEADDAGPGSDFRLYLQPGGGINHETGSGAVPLNLFRMVQVIYADQSAPYSADSPLVLVRARVWWHGKNCPPITYLDSPSDTPCKIITEEFLTNWKNY